MLSGMGTQCVNKETEFRITTTIISPTPLLAANFMIFARLTGSLGTQYSRLSPRWCRFFDLSLTF